MVKAVASVNEVLVRDDPVERRFDEHGNRVLPLDQMLETLVDDVRHEIRDEHDTAGQGGVTA
jgi:hypothetical protein